MTFAQSKGKAVCKLPALPGRSKACLYRCQPAEKSPRQPGVIDQDNPLSSGNHGRYIANRSGFDNEPPVEKKGPHPAPFSFQMM
jgi:hypothetical protein